MLMRSKSQYTLTDLCRISQIFSSTQMGTNVFWQELEEQMLIKASGFKTNQDKGQQLTQMIVNFAAQQRTSNMFFSIIT